MNLAVVRQAMAQHRLCLIYIYYKNVSHNHVEHFGKVVKLQWTFVLSHRVTASTVKFRQSWNFCAPVTRVFQVFYLWEWPPLVSLCTQTCTWRGSYYAKQAASYSSLCFSQPHWWNFFIIYKAPHPQADINVFNIKWVKYFFPTGHRVTSKFGSHDSRLYLYNLQVQVHKLCTRVVRYYLCYM